MLPSFLTGQTELAVERTFGGDFAAQVVALGPGEWSGPVTSGYGLHLVKVLELEPSRIPEWREVAGRVVSDMEFEAKASSRDQLYQEIAQNYEVVLDGEVRNLLEIAE
jgi:parvulin-like peptidyl-prolyl isomerase